MVNGSDSTLISSWILKFVFVSESMPRKCVADHEFRLPLLWVSKDIERAALAVRNLQSILPRDHTGVYEFGSDSEDGYWFTKQKQKLTFKSIEFQAFK